MKILKRHRNARGKLLWYTVDIGESIVQLDATAVYQLRNHITNAIFIGTTGEVRAKRGTCIETVVELPNKPVKEVNVKSNIGVFPRKFVGSSYIDACRKIRRYARENRFKVDNTEHAYSKNLHLFAMIKCCGWTVEDFLSGYLGRLQPFELSPYTGMGAGQHNHIWVVDIGYSYALLIKFTIKTEFEGIVISFHESIGSAGLIPGKVYDRAAKCAVFLDAAKMNNMGIADIWFTVQRGFVVKQITRGTSFVRGDVALVDYSWISSEFDVLEDAFWNNLMTIYLAMRPFPSISAMGGSLKILSFTSMGYSVQNILSMLVDVSIVRKKFQLDDAPYMSKLVNRVILEIPDELVLQERDAFVDRYSIDSKFSNYVFDLALSAFNRKLLIIEKDNKRLTER